MVDVTETVIYRYRGVQGIGFTATISTDSTITFADIVTISNAAVFKLSDGSSVTYTKATNILTITSAGLTSVKVIGMVVGA